MNETDRHAILLRFFQKKALNEVAAGLNLTENAARMRVDRALDKLRGELARRGITTTAAALAAVVSANAVQAAPAGFAAMISTAAIAGSTIHASTLIAATKTIAMTTLQKTIIVSALALAAGTGIYAVHQRSQLRGQIQTLEQEQSPLAAQIQLLDQERNQATQQLAALKEENARLKSGQTATELLKLRGQVGVLRQQAATKDAKSDAPASGLAKMMSDPTMKEYIRQAQVQRFRSLYADLFKELKLTPEQTDQFLQIAVNKASTFLSKYMAPAQGTSDQAPAGPANERENQMQALLGDAGYARYNDTAMKSPPGSPSAC